jgi:hypothetical protein
VDRVASRRESLPAWNSHWVSSTRISVASLRFRKRPGGDSELSAHLAAQMSMKNQILQIDKLLGGEKSCVRQLATLRGGRCHSFATYNGFVRPGAKRFYIMRQDLIG